MNLETNISNSVDADPRLRFYYMYLEARNLFNIATIKVGRQPLFNNIVGGSFDGVNLKLKYNMFDLSGYYGGNVPAYQKLELIDNFSDNYIMGGQFTTFLDNFKFGLSYVDKNFKPLDYGTLRLDPNFNPINMEIQNKSNQYKYGSAQISYFVKDQIRIDSRFDYDFNFETTSKFELSGRYDLDKFGFNAYYNYREPRIRYNSIFSVFNYGNTQEFAGGLDYRIDESLTLTGKFANVTYEDENSQRLALGINSTYGNLSFRKTFGYAGELNSFSAYTAKTFMDGILTPSLGVSYTNYKLSAQNESEDIISFLAGINYRPIRSISFDLQGQYMNNKIYKNDMRIFFKFNHWFNSNF